MSTEILPAAYYSETVPEQFRTTLANASPSILQQDTLVAVYTVTGDGGGTYSLRVNNGSVEFIDGALPDPDMFTTISVEDWRVAYANSPEVDPLVTYVNNKKVSVIKGLEGTVNLELTRSDGNLWHSTIVFGNQPQPEVTIRMSTDDYAAMMSGDLSGQMAFLTGKLKFEGNLPLLMKIGALSA